MVNLLLLTAYVFCFCNDFDLDLILLLSTADELMNEKWLILWVFIAKCCTARSYMIHNQIHKSLRNFELSARIYNKVKID